LQYSNQIRLLKNKLYFILFIKLCGVYYGADIFGDTNNINVQSTRSSIKKKKTAT